MVIVQFYEHNCGTDRLSCRVQTACVGVYLLVSRKRADSDLYARVKLREFAEGDIRLPAVAVKNYVAIPGANAPEVKSAVP